MKSIRIKIYLGIILIFSVLIGGVILYATTFRPFYITEKTNEMKSYLTEMIPDFNLENSEIMEKWDLQYEYQNMDLEVWDKSTEELVYSTKNNNMMGNGNGKGKGKFNSFEITEVIKVEKDFVFYTMHSRSQNLDFLAVANQSEVSDFVYVLTTPISMITESVHVSIKLLSYIMIPIILFVLILANVFSKIISDPIIKITNKTKAMERLEFTEDIVVKNRDELGVLSHSINEVSRNIELSIMKLSEQNQSLVQFIESEKRNEQLRKEFISSVSHELKTPITVICGYSAAVKSPIISSDEDREFYLNVIEEEALRMSVIVNDLLDLYKLESNTFKLKKTKFDLLELTRKCLDKYGLRLSQQHINLELSGKPCLIYGDRVRLEQVIMNYLNNAIAHVDESLQIKIRLESSESQIKLVIFNSGSWIDESDIEKIWLGFVRLDTTRNHKEKRVGLGLAIVKEIVERHEGTCGVDNVFGGVEFYMTLPVDKSPSSEVQKDGK